MEELEGFNFRLSAFESGFIPYILFIREGVYLLRMHGAKMEISSSRFYVPIFLYTIYSHLYDFIFDGNIEIIWILSLDFIWDILDQKSLEDPNFLSLD